MPIAHESASVHNLTRSDPGIRVFCVLRSPLPNRNDSVVSHRNLVCMEHMRMHAIMMYVIGSLNNSGSLTACYDVANRSGPLPLRAPDSTSQKQLVVRRSTGGPNSHSVAPSFAPVNVWQLWRLISEFYQHLAEHGKLHWNLTNMRQFLQLHVTLFDTITVFTVQELQTIDTASICSSELHPTCGTLPHVHYSKSNRVHSLTWDT